MVSSRLLREGEIVAIMHVFVRPPRESCNNRVSFDSLLAVSFPFPEEALKTCHLPIWDVRTFIHESIDHTAKSEQRFIDQTSLCSSLILSTAALDILTTSQVNQVELSRTDVVVTVLSGPLGIDRNREDRVASRAKVVAFGRSDLALVAAKLK